MIYVVFEAGSRAGWSARKFFEHYCKKYGGFNDKLILVDGDETFIECDYCNSNITSIKQSEFIEKYKEETFFVFPADELTRQRISYCELMFPNAIMSLPSPLEYSKAWLNQYLQLNKIRVPQTFGISGNVFIKPNTMSAGSKGLLSLENVCVCEKINIAEEYVVDCYIDYANSIFEFYGREVKLKNGYDKYIRFINNDSDVVCFAKEIVFKCKELNVFNGICHIQIMRNDEGELFFIEASNRISGTSIVNVLRGFNPFNLFNDIQCKSVQYDNKWHLYEDLLTEISKII